MPYYTLFYEYHNPRLYYTLYFMNILLYHIILYFMNIIIPDYIILYIYEYIIIPYYTLFY